MATRTVSYDFILAQRLQNEINEEESKRCPSNKATSAVDPSLELIDPHPDIQGLFLEFNNVYFWNRLNAVEVKWSPRMTLCAGVCEYHGKRSGYCCIKLSLPLLKLRPRKDLVETLLHEMIHAYLFVTCNNKDHDDHGPEFHNHMYRINKASGANITVYHSFHAEVDLYRQHWWRCDGICKNRKPFYGYVKRSMNRPPGAYDNWWMKHQEECGGKFVKIKEPDGYQPSKKRKADLDKEGQKKISSIFSPVNSSKSFQPTTSHSTDKTTIASSQDSSFQPFQGHGHILGGGQSKKWKQTSLVGQCSAKQLPKSTILCPVCNSTVISNEINAHLDNCLSSASHSKCCDEEDKDIGFGFPLNSFHRSLKQPLVTEHDRAIKIENYLSQDEEALIVNEVRKNCTRCPVCDKEVDISHMNSHLDSCLA